MVDLGPRRRDERHLELQARVETAADLGLGAAQQLDQAQQLAARELVGLPGQAVEQLLVDLEVLRQREHGAGVVGDVVQVLHQEDLPQVAQQVVDELRVARAALGQALHEQQGGGRVALDHDVDDLEEQLGGDHAEHVEHLARA